MHVAEIIKAFGEIDVIYRMRAVLYHLPFFSSAAAAMSRLIPLYSLFSHHSRTLSALAT